MWECPHCEFRICQVNPELGIVTCRNCARDSPICNSLESVSVKIVPNSSDGGEAEPRNGSRNKRTRKLAGASADSKRKKKDSHLARDEQDTQEQEQEHSQLEFNPIPEQIPESEIVSHPTGTYIENRGLRCQHSQRHLTNLKKNAQRISTECGWSVSIVAFPPESATKKATPLELLFPDKNGRQPPPNSKRVISTLTPKPSLVERGTQFYHSNTDNFEKILTPTKTRECLVQEMLMEDSYISPLGTSVLSLQANEIQDAIISLPESNIVLDDVIEPHQAEVHTIVTGPMQFTTPYNHSTANATSQGFCIDDQRSNTATAANTELEFNDDQSNSSRDDLSYRTPTKTCVTTTTTARVIMSQSMQTLTVPDMVLNSFDSPVEPGIIFARKSLDLDKARSQPNKRAVEFPALHPIQILGSQARRKVTAQAVKTRLPAPTCSVCGVEKMSKLDKAYRFDDQGRKRGPGKISNQWTKCQGSLASTSSGEGGPCGSTGHVSCLYENKELDLCVKNKKTLEELLYYCPDHKK